MYELPPTHCQCLEFSVHRLLFEHFNFVQVVVGRENTDDSSRGGGPNTLLPLPYESYNTFVYGGPWHCWNICFLPFLYMSWAAGDKGS